ncbi:MAG TPA: glutamate cyclase domain-containing protein [Alphaproteobacteria bacterium]
MHRDPLLNQIGENVDRLVSIDVLSYGVIGPLYEGARRLQQQGPLCLRAAELLCERVTPGATVVMLTGLILPGHHPYGETDGPLGAAVLARAIALGLSARVVIAVEPELVGLMRALLRTAELQVVDSDLLRNENGRHRPVASVVVLSRDPTEARAQAAGWIDEYGAAALIAIEKAGANSSGVYHMVGGTDISAGTSKGQPAFEEARRRGVLLIGVGDRGNELGLGPIAEVTRALLPFGTDCGCPCHGGVADQTPSDLAVPAVVSNWGAYGIATCLAAIRENPLLLHSPDREHALLATAVREGGVDGMSGRAIPAADGIGADVNAAVVAMLAEIYRAQSARDPSPFSTPLIRRRATT